MVERIKHHFMDTSFTGVSEQTVHLINRLSSSIETNIMTGSGALITDIVLGLGQNANRRS
jgi:hypothetical protein